VLSWCNFTGTIPSFNKAYCPLLNKLYLQHNNLHGTIQNLPPVTGVVADVHIKNIEIFASNPCVVLNDNYLEGQFPWQYIRGITRLDLQSNKFNGTVNFDGINIEGLIGFNISKNSFTGTIPCLQRAKNLKLLDFRYNKFTSIDNSESCKWPENTKY